MFDGKKFQFFVNIQYYLPTLTMFLDAYNNILLRIGILGTRGVIFFFMIMTDNTRHII